jgi:hypothetical protein
MITTTCETYFVLNRLWNGEEGYATTDRDGWYWLIDNGEDSGNGPFLSKDAAVRAFRASEFYPFNAAAHEALLAAGYKHERVEASWEDDGDAENGPHLSGGPAYDEYKDADSRVVVQEEGKAFYEIRDLELEAAIEAWGAECDAMDQGAQERAHYGRNV